MNVYYRIPSSSLLKFAVGGGAGVFALVAFWTESNVGGFMRMFDQSLPVAIASLTVAIAINVIFLLVAYVGIGVLLFHRTRTGPCGQWSKIEAGSGKGIRRISLSISGKELKLRVDESVLKLLKSSPPSPGSTVEVEFGPLGILLKLSW